MYSRLYQLVFIFIFLLPLKLNAQNYNPEISIEVKNASILPTPVNFVVVCKRVLRTFLWRSWYENVCPINPTFFGQWSSSKADAVIKRTNQYYKYTGNDHSVSTKTSYTNFYLGRYREVIDNELNIISNNTSGLFKLFDRYGLKNMANVFIIDDLTNASGVAWLDSPLFLNRPDLYEANYLVLNQYGVARAYTSMSLISDARISPSLENILAHEFGHNLGMPHYSGLESESNINRYYISGTRFCGIKSSPYWRVLAPINAQPVSTNNVVSCQHNHIMNYSEASNLLITDPIRAVINFPNLAKCGEGGIRGFIATPFPELGYRSTNPLLSSYGRKSQEISLCWNYVSYIYE